MTGARFLDLCRFRASSGARIQQKYGMGVISILFILRPVSSFCCLGSISYRSQPKFWRNFVENRDFLKVARINPGVPRDHPEVILELLGDPGLCLLDFLQVLNFVFFS